MKENNLVHVKVDYNEAVESKKDILSMQLNLINAIKNIRIYKIVRMKELKLKNKLKRTTASALTNIKKIENALPKIKINKSPKRKTESYVEDVNNKSSGDFVLERELQDIQEKLRMLQR